MVRFGAAVIAVFASLAGAGMSPASAQWAAPPDPYAQPYYGAPDYPDYPAYGYPPPAAADQGAPSARDDQQLSQASNEATRALVSDPTGQPRGTIVVDTQSRKLFLVLGDGSAFAYGIGVGRAGFAWKGIAKVGRKAEWPTWTPPSDMLKRRPDLPRFMEGGIDNPLGARALYLFQGKADTLFRIHGTNEPDSIGQAVSSGCIRMMNADVIDLYRRVRIGTRVVVL